MRLRAVLAIALVSLLALPGASALLLPAQPQLFATATAAQREFFAESPLVAADTLRVEAAGELAVELRDRTTGAVVASGTVTGVGVFTFPPVDGNHRLTITLLSGAVGEAWVSDESI